MLTLRKGNIFISEIFNPKKINTKINRRIIKYRLKLRPLLLSILHFYIFMRSINLIWCLFRAETYKNEISLKPSKRNRTPIPSVIIINVKK